jgi:carboxyl-terminal processing protease
VVAHRGLVEKDFPMFTHSPSRTSLWTLAAFSTLMLILGGVTLSLAQETHLVLPAAFESWHSHSTTGPDRLHGEFSSQALDLLSQSHKVEEPPDLIQVAVRPEVLRPTGNIPANYDLPAPVPVSPITPAVQPTETDAQKLQLRISARYQDPKMLSVLQSTNMRQMSDLFREVSQTIDARHVSPTSYEERTAAAIEGLVRALENPEFLKIAGAQGTDAALQQAPAMLREMIANQPARSAEEAMGVMQWSADTLNQQLGIRQEIVALEFLNATLDSLDKYSSFMPNKVGNAPSAQANLATAGLEERIVGVGIEMKKHDNGALIMGTVEGGSAAEAGLKRGDVLIRIGEQPLTGMSLNQIAELVSGPAGSTVDIQIDRAGKRYGATLDRRSVYVSSVAGTTMIDETRKVGYVKLKQFSESSA